MTLEVLQQLAQQLPGVHFDIKWESHLCFNVAEKMFVITSPDDVPIRASFKVDAETVDAWIARDGVIPAPHLARYKWVQIDDITRLSMEEWEQALHESYRLVAGGLTVKKRKELGIT